MNKLKRDERKLRETMSNPRKRQWWHGNHGSVEVERSGWTLDIFLEAKVTGFTERLDRGI